MGGREYERQIGVVGGGREREKKKERIFQKDIGAKMKEFMIHR